jgi:hypothetical protein
MNSVVETDDQAIRVLKSRLACREKKRDALFDVGLDLRL